MTARNHVRQNASSAPTSGEAEKLLLKLLGLSVYGDCRALWLELSPDERSEVCRAAREAQVTHYLYRRLPNELPPEFAEFFKLTWNVSAAQAMAEQAEFKRFCAEMEAAKVRFAPIKGLAMRAKYYPDPAMRVSLDWDVLFHPDDCAAAIKALFDRGWKPIQNGKYGKGQWHYDDVVRNGVLLEPHFAPPLLEHLPGRDLWAQLRPASPGKYRCDCPPELDLIIAARHFFTWGGAGWFASSLPKLLLDAAYMTTSPGFSWQKTRELAQKWRLPYPGDMLAAVPEFFPPTEIERMDAAPERVRTFKKLFENLPLLHTLTLSQRKLSMQRPFSKAWLGVRLRGITPDSVRIKYKLPHGRRLLLARYMLTDMAGKLFALAGFLLRPKRNCTELRRIIEEAEKVETPTQTTRRKRI